MTVVTAPRYAARKRLERLKQRGRRLAALVAAVALAVGSLVIANSTLLSAPAEAASLDSAELKAGASSTQGLYVKAYRSGSFAVFVNNVPQFFAGPRSNIAFQGMDNGTDWFINDFDYYTAYLTGYSAYISGTSEGTLKIANATLSQPSADTLHWIWEQDNLIFEQTITLRPGSYTLERTWGITNKTSSTIQGGKLFSGGDTYFDGADYGYAGHSNPLDMTYVYRDATAGLMAFRGGEETPADRYYGGWYDDGMCYLTAPYACDAGTRHIHELPNTVSGNVTTVDQGVYLQWNMPDIAPDGRYTVAGEITFEPPGQLFVLGESLKSVQPGQTLTKQFVLVNVGTAAVQANLTVRSSQGWTAQVASPVTVPPNGGDGVLVSAQVTVPATAAHGDEDTLTVTATYTPTGGSGTLTRTGVARTRVYDPQIVIEPYIGTYDGQAHDAIDLLTFEGVDILADDARPKQYSTDGGTTWSPTMPSFTAAGTYPIKIRVAGAELPTIEIPTMVIIGLQTLTVSVPSVTVYAGETPNYTISYSGWIGSETAATAAGFVAPTVATPYDPANPLVDTYDLTLAGGDADNYAFSLGGQPQLTVSPALTLTGDGLLSGTAGQTTIHTFTLVNHSSLARTVTVSSTSDLGWAVSLRGVTTVTVPAQGSTTLMVDEAVPAVALKNARDKVTLTVDYAIGSSPFSIAAEAETGVGTTPPAVRTSTLTIIKNNADADDIDVNSVRATVRSAGGELLEGIAIDFTLPAGVTAGTTAGPAVVQVVTDDQGRANLNLTSLIGGQAFSIGAAIVSLSPGDLTPVNVTFTPLPPVLEPQFSSYDVSTTAVKADGVEAVTVTIVLTNRLGAPVTGQATVLDFNATGGGNLKGLFQEGPDGTYTASLRSTQSGDKTVTTTYSGSQVPLRTGGNNIAHFLSVAPTSSVTATPEDGSEPVYVDESWRITVRPVTPTGDPIGGLRDVTVSIDPKVTVGPVEETSPGVYEALATTATAGPYTVTATAGGVTLIQQPQIEFLGGPAIDPNRSTLTVTPLTQTAGSAIQATIRARDKYDNPITDLTTLTTGVTGQAVAPTVAPSISAIPSTFVHRGDGVYTLDITSTKAGDFRLAGTVRGTELNQHPAVKFTAGAVSAANTWAQVIKPSALADGIDKVQVKVHAADIYDNVVVGATVIGSRYNNTALNPDPNQVTTGSDGEALLEWTSQIPGTYTATLTVDGVTQFSGSTQNQLAFTTGDADPRTSRLAVRPTLSTDAAPIVAGHSYTAIVTLLNERNQAVAGDVVTFDINTVDGYKPTLSAVTCTSRSDGTCEIEITSTKAATFSLTAKIQFEGALTHVQHSPFALTWRPDAVCVAPQDGTCSEDPTKRTRVEVTKDNQLANGVATDEATLYAFDRLGNPVPDAAWVSTTSDSSLTIATPSGSTGPAGTAVISYTSVVQGSHPAVVSVAGKALPTILLSFTNVPWAKATLTVAPVYAQPVDSNFTLTAMVEAAGGMPINGASVTLTSPSPDLRFVGGPTCTTNAQGQCTVQVTSTKAGSHEVGFAGDPAPQVVGSPTTVEFEAGPLDAARSYVEVIVNGAKPYNRVTDQDIVKVVARDQYDNPVIGATAGSSVADNRVTVLSGAITPTDVNGTTQIGYTASAAGTYQAHVTVTKNGQTITPSRSPVDLLFSEVVIDASKSTWTLSPKTAIVVGTESANAFTATVTARDAAGELAVGGVVSFQIDPVEGPTWGLGLSSCTTNTQGQCSVTVSSTKAGSYAVTARAQGDPIGEAQPAVWNAGEVCGVECTPVTPDQTLWTRVVVTRNNAPADGSSADVVTVWAFDKWGNPVPEQPVSSNTTNPNLRIEQSPAPTGNGQNGTTRGVATISYYSQVTGTYEVTDIKVAGKTPRGLPVDLTFVPGCIPGVDPSCPDDPNVPNEKRTHLEVTRDNQAANGTATDQVTLFLFDQRGNVVGTQPVASESIDGQVTVVSPVAATNGQGQSVISYTSTTVGGHDVAVRVYREGVWRDVTFIPQAGSTPPASYLSSPATITFGNDCIPGLDPGCTVKPEVDNEHRSRIVVDPDNQKANGTDRNIATVYLFDASGHPVVGAQVSSTSVSTGLTIQAPGTIGVTNASGQTTIWYSSTVEGQATARAFFEITGQAGQGEVTFTPQPGSTPPASYQSSPFQMTFADATLPAAPVIVQPTEGAYLNTNRPTVSGTGQPGATLTVTEGARTIGTVTVSSGGTWTLTSPLLTDGAHEFQAVQTDSAGTSPETVRHFTVDTTPPAPPVVTTPAAGAVINNENGQTVAGTAEPGATVTVRGEPGSPTGPVLCTAVTDTQGNWSCQIPSNLLPGEGPHTLYADATDQAGNVSDETEVAYTVDNSRPETCAQNPGNPNCFTIVQPAEGATVADATPTFAGTGEPSTTVTIKEGAALLCTTTVGQDGQWTCDSTVTLANGAHTVVGQSTDAAGNVSQPVTRSFAVDSNTPPTCQEVNPELCTDPNALRIDRPTEGQVVGTANVQFDGHGQPSTTVRVMEGSTLLCSTTVAADNTWSCTSTVALPDGAHRVQATQTNAAGTASAPYVRNFSVDTTRPVTCAEDPSDPFCFDIIQPAEGSTVPDATPTFSGKGEPATTVTVTEGSDLLCQATVAANGQWSCDSTRTLVDGPHTVVGQATDAAGNVSDPVTRSFTVDPNTPPTCQFTDPTLCTDPSALRIDRPTEGQAVNTPNVQFEGHGLPTATVRVMEGSTLLCTTTVAADNTWSCASTVALPDGAHRVEATQTSVAGLTSTPYVRNFSVDTMKPVTCAEDPSDPFCFDIVYPGQGSTIPDSTPTFSGTGEPGTTVTVKEGSDLLCQATVAADGQWSCDSTKTLADGSHTVVGRATDAAGNVSDPVERSFTVDPNIPPTCEFADPTLCTDPSALRIDRPTEGQAVKTANVQFEGHGLPTATVRVMEGSELLCTTTVAADNTWSCTSTVALPDGAHRVEATQTNAAGTTSAPYVRNFTVDTVRPVTCAEDPSDPFCFDITYPVEGSTIPDSTPTFSGTGEPTTTVTVKEGSDLLCQATVATNGQWSCDSTKTLADGSHTVVGQATDAAGNASTPVTRSFAVDPQVPPTCAFADPALCTNPNALRIDRPTEGQAVKTPNVQFDGHGLPTATVRVLEGSTLLCTTTVAADNTWSCTSTVALPEGAHRVEATQTSVAGLTSAPYVRNFTVDTTAPVTCAEDPTAPNCFDITRPAEGSTIPETRPVFEGTGEPGATVDVTDDRTGEELCSTVVGTDGQWQCTSTEELPQGDNKVSGTLTDPAGNESAPVERQFRIDPNTPPTCLEQDPALCTDPNALRIDRPTEGQAVKTPNVRFVGHGLPTATVRVMEGSELLCTTTVASDNTWSCTSTVALPEGAHRVEATQTSLAGLTSQPYVRNFTVDTTAPVTCAEDPDAPNCFDITRPAEGSTIPETKPVFEGTGEPGATVQVKDDRTDEQLCVTVVGTDGQWQCTSTKELPQGDNKVTGTLTDPAGNESAPVEREFRIDPNTPPTCLEQDPSQCTDPNALRIDQPTEGQAVKTPNVRFIGHGLPTATVRVMESGSLLCTTTVAADNTWSCTSTVALPEGAHRVEATQTSVAGLTSAPYVRNFTVDTTAPVTCAEDPTAPNCFDITRPAEGSTIPETKPVFEGTGEPGATVKVKDDRTGDQLCVSVVGADGQWQCTSIKELPQGDNKVSGTISDPAGNESAPVEREFRIDPNTPPTCESEDPAQCTDPNALRIDQPTEGQAVKTPNVRFIGHGLPTATVRVVEGGSLLCTTTVAADNTWSCTSTVALPEGAHRVEATQTSLAGLTSAPYVRNFTVDTTAPVTCAEDPTAPNCFDIVYPAEGSTIPEVRPTFSGTGEPSTTVTVKEGSDLLCQAAVQADGQWNCQSTKTLSDGTHEVVGQATDAAGNVSAPVNRVFSVDPNVPPTCAFPDPTQCTDPNALRIDRPTEGQSVSTPRVQFDGHGLPTATVRVMDGSQLLCTTTVAANNTWSCTSTVALPDGAYRVEATQTSVAGLTSAPYVRNFSVDTVRPVTCAEDPTDPYCFDIIRPIEGSTIPNPQPTFRGSGEPGTTVTVKEGSELLCLTTVGPDGQWSCDSTKTLADGSHTVVGQATDAAGNASAPVTRSFAVDPHVPPTCEVEDCIGLPDPNALRIDRPTEGQAVKTPNVQFDGHGMPTATVRVTEGSTLLCTTTIAADYTWSCTSTVALPEGAHRVEATQTSLAGLTSAPYVRNFTVDTTAPVTCAEDPAAPNCFDITRPAEGSTIPEIQPVFEGTGEPGATVEVTDERTAAQLCSTVVGVDGRWQCTSTEELPQGDNKVTGTLTDPAGNESAPVEREFRIDSNTPPTCLEQDPALCTDPNALRIDRPTEGQAVNTARVQFEGHGLPTATVRVMEGSTLLCTTTVAAGNTWSCTSTVALPEGAHRVEATQTSVAGLTSAPYVRNFTVDLTAPVTCAEDPAAPNCFDITRPSEGSTIPDTKPVFEGTGEPGATVEVTDDQTGEQLCSAVVGTDGRWQCTSTKELPQGDNKVTGTLTDPAGNESEPVEREFVVDPNTPPTCRESDPTLCTDPNALRIDQPTEGQAVKTPNVRFVGHGLPKATVRVMEGGTLLCTTTVASDNTWSCTSTVALPDGAHRVQATQSNAAGLTSEPYVRNFTVDTVAPVTCAADPRAPNCFDITKPGEGEQVGDNRPTFEGTGEPGGSVKVVDDETREVLCTTIVGLDGQWTCQSTSTLPDGDHTVTGTITDPAGNESDEAQRHFEIDTVPPVTCAADPRAPNCFDITKPGEGEQVGDNRPTFEGTGEPGGSVKVVDDETGEVLCTATVGADGRWTCESTTSLPDGDHTVTGTITDPAGNESDEAQRHFEIDTVPPVTCAADPTAPNCFDITKPSEGEYVGDNRPTFEGTGEPGGSVKVVDDETGEVLCTTTVGLDGQWTCRSTSTLPDGGRTVTGTVTDPAGNESDEVKRHFEVDTVPPTVCLDVDATKCTRDPTALRIDRPAENQQVNTPRVVFEGHGEPNATVQIKEGDLLLCSATVKSNNTWVCTSSVSLADGQHVAVATQADRAGNVSEPYVRNFGVDTKIEPPVVTKPGAGESINNDLGQEVAGSAEPGSTVRVEDEASGEELCTAVADATGHWSCEVPTDQRPGEGDHTLIVTAEDPAGNVSDSTKVDYVVDNTGPAVRIVTPVDGAGVPAGYPDRPLVVSGTGETAGDRIVISDGQGNTCTTQVKSNLTWSCTYNKALPEGPTTITATATDQAGNTGSDHRDIIVDRTAPDAPKVNEPIDGGYVDTDRPVIAGEGDPGDTIKVVDEDGRVLCDDVLVQADGTWSCTASESLPEEDHVLTVTETDPAGNVSEGTVVEITVDTTAPAQPIVTKPAEGAVINESRVTVEGTAEPGATVRVVAAPDNICTTVADASGHFTCQLPKSLPEGPARIVVVAIDPASNVSEPLEVNFTVDTEAPTPPSVDTRDPDEITGKTDPDTTVVIEDDEGKSICQTVSDEDGNWSCHPSRPLQPGDEITVIARDDAGNSSSVTVRILLVRVDKPTLAAGEEQTARGLYFQPGERVHGIWWVDGQAVDLGWQNANGVGEVTFTWPIPTATARHLYEVDLVGDVSGPGTAAFQVTNPLPATGSLVGLPFVTGAGLATLAGLGFILVAWRRRRDAESAQGRHATR